MVAQAGKTWRRGDHGGNPLDVIVEVVADVGTMPNARAAVSNGTPARRRSAASGRKCEEAKTSRPGKDARRPRNEETAPESDFLRGAAATFGSFPRRVER